MASGDTLILWSALDAELPASNYATFGVRNNHPVRDFDDTTGETIYLTGVMPRNYASGNIVVYVHFAAKTATSGTGGWLIAFERLTAQDTDSDGFGSDQTITAVNVSGTSGIPTSASVTVTAGAATDSVAAGELFRIKVTRDVANDNAAGDLQLFAVELKEA